MNIKGYVLFVVLNDVKRLKSILKILKQNNVSGATVIDTMGSSCLYRCESEYAPMIAGMMQSIENGRNYSKTIYSVIYREEVIFKVMDEIDEELNLNPSRLGKGIMFTVPIYSCLGIRELNKK